MISKEEIPLYFKTSGYVNQVFVQQGQHVMAGSVLAELGGDALEYQITTAELNLEMAQATLKEAEETNAYAIAQAESALTLAQEQLNRTLLLQENYTTSTTIARVALERARTRAVFAQDEYQKALDRPWEDQLIRDNYERAHKEAQWELQITQAEYAQAINNELVYQQDLNIVEAILRQSELELTQLKKGVGPVLHTEIEQAQQALDELKDTTQIVAPADGIIVSTSLYPGQLVEPFGSLLIMASSLDVEISANPSQEQLQTITEGQVVTVAHSLDPQRAWAGTVRSLPYPYSMGGNTANSGSLDNTARISLEGDVSSLNLGELMGITLVLEEKDDVLWLPSEVIRTYQGSAFIILLDGEYQRRVNVELGIEGPERVEITQGLEENQVILGP
ncbi:MAG: efflux RND transporter periplasmic adaptor subunit [Anaerolineae bacterium]|nr:efflux RND transporter periplasmic adaptor subunit [Anaerolineae bacterium]